MLHWHSGILRKFTYTRSKYVGIFACSGPPNSRASIGWPSISWFKAVLCETDNRAGMPSPEQAAICYLGKNDQIVSNTRIIERIEKWGNGRLINVRNAKHEILMMHEAVQKNCFRNL